MMPPTSKLTSFLNALVALVIAVIFLIPVYILLVDFPENEDVLAIVSGDSITDQPTLATNRPCLDSPQVLPADDGLRIKEEKRLIRTLTTVQTKCDRLELPGTRKQVLTTEREDLRWKSYVCVGGNIGLKKHDCLVYSFGINHRWSRFPDLVEKHLGCRVHVFDPAVDYIDHYYTKNVRFFNARLSDIDQQAQYTVAGEKGWKRRRFVTLIKDFHFINEPIDHLRLDITLDLWPGMSTMLKDGSLVTYVKQLSIEYDLNKKNAEKVREMFAITQWLNKQGFRLAHSQRTKLSGKSFSVLYVNTHLGMLLNRDGNIMYGER